MACRDDLGLERPCELSLRSGEDRWQAQVPVGAAQELSLPAGARELELHGPGEDRALSVRLWVDGQIQEPVTVRRALRAAPGRPIDLVVAAPAAIQLIPLDPTPFTLRARDPLAPPPPPDPGPEQEGEPLEGTDAPPDASLGPVIVDGAVPQVAGAPPTLLLPADGPSAWRLRVQGDGRVLVRVGTLEALPDRDDGDDDEEPLLPAEPYRQSELLPLLAHRDVSPTADFSVVSDHAGRFTLTTAACSAQALLVATDPSLDQTVDTYSHHVVTEPTATHAEVGSVAMTTYLIIPSLLGISPDPADGLVIGTALDCDGERLEGAQVVMRDASTGALAEGHIVKYFVQDFPNRDQEETSADGLWIAIDVPPGDWVAELYTSDGAGGHDLMASTPVQVRAESLHMIETQVGHQTGVVMPTACLDC